MMSGREFFPCWVRVVLLLLLSIAGCMPQPVVERKGAIAFKLLAPDPLMRAKASDEMKEAYGISEWRFYRGKGGVYVTGYNDKGKAMKGLSTLIARTDDGDISHLELHVNNGSKASMFHSLATDEDFRNKDLPVESQAFLQRAVLDFARIGTAADLQLRSPGQAASAANVCASALPNSFASLGICLSQAGNNATAIQRCQLAAQLAEQSRLTCHGLASPLGGVAAPLPLSLFATGDSDPCRLDPTCSFNRFILQRTQNAINGCGTDLSCQVAGSGFDRFARNGPASSGTEGTTRSATGTTGGSSLPGSRPNLSNLKTGTTSTTSKACSGSSCKLDDIKRANSDFQACLQEAGACGSERTKENCLKYGNCGLNSSPEECRAFGDCGDGAIPTTKSTTDATNPNTNADYRECVAQGECGPGTGSQTTGATTATQRDDAAYQAMLAEEGTTGSTTAATTASTQRDDAAYQSMLAEEGTSSNPPMTQSDFGDMSLDD